MASSLGCWVSSQVTTTMRS